MANLNGFDAATVEPAEDFEAIPAGKYLAVVTESEMKPTKNGGGNYLQLTFQIIDGKYRNRNLWARLNLDNSSQTAVEIAKKELSAICRAVGVMAPKDSAELHSLPLVISVKCKKREDTGDVVNEIKGYAKKEAVSGKPQQAAENTPPWLRK